MKDKKAVLYGKDISCPCCGSILAIGATVRLKCKREIGQDSMDDYPEPTEPYGIRPAPGRKMPDEDTDYVKDEGQEAGDGA